VGNSAGRRTYPLRVAAHLRWAIPPEYQRPFRCVLLRESTEGERRSDRAAEGGRNDS